MGLVQKTVYIREEDLEAWSNVSNKALWIHEGLMTGLVVIPPKTKTPDTPVEPSDTFIGSGINLGPNFGIVPEPCKHGFDRRYCKHAKFDKTRNQKWCKL